MITQVYTKKPFLPLLANIWFYLLIILVIGMIIQVNLILCPDTCWLIHVGERFIAGGNYYNDYFEVNPPMGIYIYLPPILFAKLTQLNIILIMRMYFFAVITASLIICCHLIDAIIPPGQKLINNALKLSLAIVFIILPAEAFTEREHMMLLLTMPYILSIALLSMNKTIPRWQIIIIGLCAGIGFAIKPFFLVGYACCEGYLIFKKKSLRSYFRLESYLVFLTILAYLLSIYVFARNYVTEIVPFIRPLYYLVNNYYWHELLFNFPVIYWLLTSILYLGLRKKSRHKELLDLLELAATSFLGVYFLQLTTWYYHSYPFFAFSTLVATLLFVEMFSTDYIVTQTLLCKNNIIFSYIFLMLLLPLSFVATKTDIFISSRYEQQTVKLINLFKSEANNSNVYYLNTFVEYTTSLEFYSNAHTVSRFPSLWMLLGVKILAHLPPTLANRALIEKTQSFVINTVITELIQNKPKFILSQDIPDNEYVNFRNMHYLPILLQYPSFKAFFKDYVYIGTLDEEDIYRRNN